MVDYRTNVDRQAREQKSVGSLLSILVYALIAFVVIGSLLAGYGAYIVSEQLHQQSATVSDLDKKYAAANKDLNTKLAATQDTLTQAQAQITSQQDLIVKQQDTINKLLAATADNTTALQVTSSRCAPRKPRTCARDSRISNTGDPARKSIDSFTLR